ncbi:uncharacterized protein I303_104267 [Kwoniella dejecticola CBS 10117]|uniref:Proteasome assembly chaperone 4 n=1 Tax=Kwoniella dejecticola CBS 10117 TaxID=1296121 RepID=A0A1A6A5T2_9TREE|nr:uncharacterized protein I303_04756 [Kwoniella dejecticola CBS 10117]OBR85421.1 hypothetical protein I303_04756 [Kwoniella dejecticola CBS 10117]
MSLDPTIRTYHQTLPSPLPNSPSFVFHLTRLVDTLMIWIGTGSPSDPISGTDNVIVGERKIAGDWAVAMPSRGNISVTATPVYRASASDYALPMSQRLARKFPNNQIHLSLSLPASLTSQSGPNLDPYASKLLLIMEKKLGSWLSEVIEAEKDLAPR